MHARLVIACGGAALAVLAVPASAQSDYARDGWDTIGSKTVNSGLDNDHLRVRGNVRYKKVRLCAVGQPIELRNMTVVFHNGQRQVFPANRLIPAGSCTSKFDLAGRRRNMDHIYLTYSPLFRAGAPEVLIQAK